MTALQIVERTIGNVEAEMALIGAMLCEPKVIDSVADRVDPSDFADSFLGFVYGTIVREQSLGRALNPVTLRPFLEPEQAYRDLGGWDWLAGLGSSPVTSIGASSNAAQISSLAQRRRLVDGLRETLRAAGDLEQSIESLVEMADEALTMARESGDCRGEYSAAECLQLVIDGFDRPIGGVTCGNILSIDQLIGPMQPSQFIVWAGRPGMGKSLTAQSYALGAAGKGHGVLFVSLEMSAEQLGERMAADLCYDRHRIPHDAIRFHRLDPDQKRIVCCAKDYLENLPLQIIDKPGITIAQLRSLVRRWQRKFEARGQKLELVIVDYLQRMGGKGDAYERISEISRSAKDLAKECGVAICAMAQLSRKVEERSDKRPNLADLRDSGQIEQDADAVLFFLRDEYYLKSSEPPIASEKHAEWQRLMDDCKDRIEFICAKHRHATTDSLMGEFQAAYQAVRG
ncbi:MAG TPA: DnaB-like helicase C-terminal domain-containing protein [Nitrobacter sp.]|nr:DnaB-like helicase C-terminal domain-containing protein [Nitrobacter sp.]